MLPRSFSPTNDSSAITNDTVIGKKPTIISKKGTSLSEVDLTGPVVVIMGSEDKGISRELSALASQKVSIPMSGNIASLNVSVATGIMLYEIVRQRSAL